MSSFCLRYRAIDVGLEGELVVGREEGCGLVLDDALVSRQHAKFHVAADGVRVEDLASRNGVHVNGVRIEGPTALRLGDTVRIGSQVLILGIVGERGLAARPPTSELVSCPGCGNVVAAMAERCPTCRASLHAEDEAALADASPSARPAFKMLSALADKALSMGRHDEAERILSGTLDGVLHEAHAGAIPSQETLRDAVTFAFRLAAAGSRTRLDYVLQLYTALGRMMSGDDVEQFYRLATDTRYANPRSLRGYLDCVRAQAVGANERFLLQRLEGLERRLRSG